MELRILMKNLSAQESGGTEEFPAAQYRELTLGRDVTCDVKCESNNDVVSRRHAKIWQSADDPSVYLIEDMGSRNGTFVNRQRISGPVRLSCGDQIQLGVGGQVYEFSLGGSPRTVTERLASNWKRVMSKA